MKTIACIVVFLWIKSHLFKKNSSHTENQLNGYNITGDINGRPVHTMQCFFARTYVRYVRAKKHCMQCFFARTGRTYGPYVRVVCTGL